MDKPRICEVLGIEVGEEATYKDPEYGELTFRILETGNIEFIFKNGRKVGDIGMGFAIAQAINHPERIIRKPRWTEQEVELAKALYDFRRSESVVIGRNKGGTLWWRDGLRSEGILPKNLFPSLDEGNSFKLFDIIGGAQ